MRIPYFLVLFFYISLSVAQNEKRNFIYKYVSSEKGISHNFVSKIVSDSLNIKWISTESGVTKYDGTNFYTIKPGKKYPELKSENIETLFLDRANNLWIGNRSGGLSKLNIKSHILKSYDDLLSNSSKKLFRIKAIEEDNQGNIWVGTGENGIYVINVKQNKIVKHIKTNELRFIKKDSEGNIWFPKGFDLKKYNPKDGKLTTYTLGTYISAFVEDLERNCFWLGTINKDKEHHIIKFDKTSKTHTAINTGIASWFTSSLLLDKDNFLWIGTFGQGIYLSNSKITDFKRLDLFHHNSLKTTDSYTSILDIHEDKDGVIWISAGIKGVITLKQSIGFHNLNSVVNNPELKIDSNILSIFGDKEHIYLGTLGKGVFKGKDLSSLKHIKNTNGNIIQAIGKHNDHILIGQDENVLFLNKKGNTKFTLDIPKATFFLPQNDSILWVGSQQKGLFKLKNIKNEYPKIVKNYYKKDLKSGIESSRITNIAIDNDKNLWVTTFKGLYLYNTKEDRFLHYSTFSTGKLPSIHNTLFIENDHIWLGTPRGLFKLKYEAGVLQVLKTYTSSNGLENEFICGIASDNISFLWLTTPSGLIRFDTFSESFLNYGKDEGVYTTLFNKNSIFNNTINSTIYSGGVNNLTYFNPEDIMEKPKAPRLVFTHLKIDNKKIEALDTINEHVILDKDFNYTKSIELSHKEKSFDIGFSNINNTTNSAIDYRYKLIGFDEKWRYIQEKNEVSFVGLPAGSYTLLIGATIDNKIWSEPLSLAIDILHSPWFSPFAYFIYFLFFFALLTTIVVIIMRQLQLKQTILKEKELSELKFTFFTNISHEIRTPLTLIISPLKEILQTNKNLEPKLIEQLTTVEKNSNRLFNLVNQLLDFRKAEHGLLKLKLSNGNFARFSYEVFLYFKQQAKIKNIKYTFNCNKKEIYFPFDRSKMEIVLSNLISNALKYSKANDKISLYVESNLKYCIIKIKDTGIGMSKGYTDKIFDRFYQIKSTITSNIIGSGIGLSFTKQIIELHQGEINVESVLNQGTQFTIKLPLMNEFYEKENIQPNHKINSDEIENYISLDTIEVRDLEATTKKQTILIIDDNLDIRNYLMQMLSNDYNTLQAKDGIEGIEIAKKEIPDIILCDIMMPKKDGLSTCKDLKSDISTSHIPVILLTARSSNMYEIEGLEIGANDFITKPFDPQIIKARISSSLQNRKKIREYFQKKIRFEPSSNNIDTEDLDSVFIKKAILLVENNLSNEEFDIQTMMDNFHMSQSSLYRKVKSLTGLSIIAFIRSVRLKKAAEYILTENDKLSTVSQKVGFNDYKYFRDSFKKQFQCLPSEYKAKIIQEK